MLYYWSAVLATAAVSSALTPDGFEPGSETQLLVLYGNIAATNGQVEPKDAVQTQPNLATQQKLAGEYAVIMIDLDIPTDNPPETNTLLHWMQTGLTSATRATGLNTTSGSSEAFLLQNKQSTAALAPYLGPSPPDRVPLSHRYTQILVNHTGISAEGLQALTSAAQNRSGFDAQQVLTSAGLINNVVAGNFFNVTNTSSAGGDSSSSFGGSGSGDGEGEGGDYNSTGSGSGGLQGFNATGTVTTAAAFAMGPQAGTMAICLAIVGAVFLGL